MNKIGIHLRYANSCSKEIDGTYQVIHYQFNHYFLSNLKSSLLYKIIFLRSENAYNIKFSIYIFSQPGCQKARKTFKTPI